uniref:EEIG1/EHBP1 N-terminal domain-containing protein n=1 Tax=Tanacetum cinerariifolium TaxID=118510 RepID=A0A6L2MHF6_TANCI|nr:EEIG1/EHBP1 N-terminal domain-containing protein [Tanacetum cinerariifolium]
MLLSNSCLALIKLFVVCISASWVISRAFPAGSYVVSTGRVIVSTGRYIAPTGRYVVPTGRYVVPTGRYVVPTGRVIVPTGRYIVPADPNRALMSTQQYMEKVVEDVGEDDVFKSAACVSATNYVNAFGGTVTRILRGVDNFLKKEKLEQVVGIVKSCSPNMLGDLNVSLKDLSDIIPGTILHKVIVEGGYGKDFTIGAAMILKNVSVFTPKPSKHYLNITMRNVVEVFRKDTVPGSGSGRP